MINADEFKNWGAETKIECRWVFARPMPGNFFNRFKDAIKVLIGDCDAVKFYKQ